MTEDEAWARLLRFLTGTVSNGDYLIQAAEADRALSPDEIKLLFDRQREYWGF